MPASTASALPATTAPWRATPSAHDGGSARGMWILLRGNDWQLEIQLIIDQIAAREKHPAA
jgi:hypothetical protein